MRRMTDAAPTGPAELKDPTEPKDPKLHDPWLDQNGVLKYWGGDKEKWIVYRSPPEPRTGEDPEPPWVEKKAADEEDAVRKTVEAASDDGDTG